MIIKYCKEDLAKLNFRYIVQINNHDHHDNIFDGKTNTSFWIEKRMKFVTSHPCSNDELVSCYLTGCYYGHKAFTAPELVEALNRSEGRYYRLLTEEELAAFNEIRRKEKH